MQHNHRDSFFNKSSLIGLASVSSLTLMLPSSSVQGAGLWLYERGNSDIGTANAGRMSTASDASNTAGGNVAGMTYLDGHELTVGLQPMYLDTKFDSGAGSTNTGGDGGNAGGFIPAAGIASTFSVTDDFKLGVSVGSFFGIGVEWNDDWVGRYFATELEFMTIAAMPSAAYRISDWLSVGVGAALVSGNLENKSKINNIIPIGDGDMEFEDDAFGAGVFAAVLIEPRKGTRIGFGFNSEIDQEFEDRPKYKNVGPAIGGMLPGKLGLDFDLPMGVMGSVTHEINEKWTIMGNVGWQDWDSFGNVGVSIGTTDGSGSFTTDSSLDETWHFAIGAEYKHNEKWKFQAGFAYDTSPVDDDDRTITMLFDEQFRYALGTEYKLKENITLGFAYELVDLGDNDLEQSSALGGTLQGDFPTNYLHLFNTTIRWQF